VKPSDYQDIGLFATGIIVFGLTSAYGQILVPLPAARITAVSKSHTVRKREERTPPEQKATIILEVIKDLYVKIKP